MTITQDELFCAKKQEGFKLLVHLGLFGFGLTCAMYNLGAYLNRNEKHLVINASIYGALALWEVDQIRRHSECL